MSVHDENLEQPDTALGRSISSDDQQHTPVAPKSTEASTTESRPYIPPFRRKNMQSTSVPGVCTQEEGSTSGLAPSSDARSFTPDKFSTQPPEALPEQSLDEEDNQSGDSMEQRFHALRRDAFHAGWVAFWEITQAIESLREQGKLDTQSVGKFDEGLEALLWLGNRTYDQTQFPPASAPADGSGIVTLSQQYAN